MAAITLSFLKEQEQKIVEDCISLNKYKLDIKKADLLRQYSEKSKLDADNVYLILSGETVPKKPNQTPAVKLNKKIYAKYFKPNQPVKEVHEILEKALEMYFNRQEK